jgi:hypothetical protein
MSMKKQQPAFLAAIEFAWPFCLLEAHRLFRTGAIAFRSSVLPLNRLPFFDIISTSSKGPIIYFY